MAIAKGTAKSVAYKKETTPGTLAGTSGAKYIRRVTSDFNLEKETYESSEIRTDRQVAVFNHGVKSASGSLNGELSPASYSDFIQSIVARDFTTAPTASSLSLTIAASASLWTITRATGSWLTDGFQPGMVIRLSGGTLHANNSAKNLLIVSIGSATVLTVSVLNGTAMQAEGPIASTTATAQGKVTYVPATGHTDDSYSIEEWYPDIAQSEVFTGMKVNSVGIQLPSTGFATIDVGFAGINLGSSGTTQYFSTPTAQNSNGVVSAVNGALIVNGAVAALVTSVNMTIDRATENATAVGSNAVQEIFTGRIRVSGNMSVYFQDAVFRNYFKDETTASLVVALAVDSSATSQVVTFTIPKVKLGSFSKSDAELGIIASADFTALLNDVTSGGLPATTIAIQDSAA